MNTEPEMEHQWLQKFVGDWSYESEMPMGPDQPAMKCGGTESVRSLGGLWILGEGKGEIPGGGSATTMLTLGYDPRKKRFVGTWIGSMMANLWIYEGVLNGNTLTLNTEGPSMTGDGSLAKYQDIVEFTSDDHRVLSSQVLGAGGQWTRIMTAHYQRTK